MSAYKAINSDNFLIIPISILKDHQKNGIRTELIHFNDLFNPYDSFLMKNKFSKNIFTTCHFHEGIEILKINSGNAEVTVEDNSFLASKNDLIIINPFDSHSIYVEDTSAEFERTCIIFQPNVFFGPERTLKNNYYQSMKNVRFKNYIPAGSTCNALLCECIDNITGAFEEKQPGWPLAVMSNLIMFYSHIISGGLQEAKADSPPYQYDFMNQISDYIEKNYTQDLSTADAAAHCLYTTEHFCRLFKKCFYKSFKDYLNLYRIQKAKDFIDEGCNATITEISARFGFNNQNHFSHMFKRYLGILPSEYIKSRLKQ